MKVELYMDVWPGHRDQTLTATDNPYRKPKGCRRFRITTDVPDYAFTDSIDGNAPVNTIKEVDDHE